MASGTGTYAHLPPEPVETGTEQGEMEPLLGRPGDAVQPTTASMVKNLVLGEMNFQGPGGLLL
jgi:hypothetical protein